MLQLANYKELSINGIDMKELYADGVCIWKAITSRIPSEYQEVEYIKANDMVAAYIDLGFSFDTKAKVYIGQIVGTIDDNPGYVFGAAENSGKLRCMLSSPYGRGPTLYGSNKNAYLNVGLGSGYIENTLNEFELIFKEGELRITNITKDKSYVNANQAEYTMTSNLYLFGQNYNGSPRYGYQRTITHFKYYNKNDELICDLVPCYRKYDGVIGMYDVARKKFLTNAGSGTFTKGADV